MREKLAALLEALFYPTILAVFMGILYGISYVSDQKPENTGVPVVPAQRALIVPVMVDGIQLKFQVDTGSTTTILNESALALMPPYYGSCIIQGAFGGASPRCYISVLGHVETGGIEAYNVPVNIVPLGGSSFSSHIDGVLGIDFMRNYTVIFDNERFTLVPKEEKQ